MRNSKLLLTSLLAAAALSSSVSAYGATQTLTQYTTTIPENSGILSGAPAGTYSGNIFEITAAGDINQDMFHSGTFNVYSTDADGNLAAATSSGTTGTTSVALTNGSSTSGSQNLWWYFAGPGAAVNNIAYGQTLYVSSATLANADLLANMTFGPVSLGGLIVGASDHKFTTGRMDKNIIKLVLEGNAASGVVFNIASDTTIRLNVSNGAGVEARGTQHWTVAQGKNLVFGPDGQMNGDYAALQARGRGTIELAEGSTIVIDGGGKVIAGGLSGNGRIELGKSGHLLLTNGNQEQANNSSGTSQNVTLAGSKFSNWTGTVSIEDRDVGPDSSAYSLNAFGTSGSTIELAGMFGYFSESNSTVNANLVLKNSDTENRTYAVRIGNGSSSATMVFAGSVSGDGTFQLTRNPSGGIVTQSFRFQGDLSQYSGRIETVNSTNGGDLIFGNGGEGVTGTNDDGSQKSVSGTGTINWNPHDTSKGSTIFNYSNNVFSASTIEGTSRIVKRGAGSLTLTGTNTYTGGTTVETGRLVAGSASAFGKGALTVNAGAEISANGNNVDLGSGNITINGTYVISQNGMLTTSGSITLGTDGALDITGIESGSYTIFGGTGTVSRISDSTKLLKTSARDLVVFADDHKSFTLTKGASYNLKWTADSTEWTADSEWSVKDNPDQKFTCVTGDTVWFEGEGDHSITISTEADVQAMHVSGGNWTFTGTETSTLNIREDLTISDGATFASGGLLDATIGGTVNLNGTNATLKLVGAGISGLANAISGSGKVILEKGSAENEINISTADLFTDSISVEKKGDNKVTVSAAQSYSGGTTITEGNLGIAHNSALGTGTVTLNGGQMTAQIGGLNLSNAVVVSEAGGTIHMQAQTLTLSGVVSGTGTLTKTGTGTLALTNQNTQVNLSLQQGIVAASNATLNVVSATTDNGETTVTLNNNATLNISGDSINISAINSVQGTNATNFTKKSGAASAEYTVDSWNSTSANGYARNVTVDEGVTVNMTNFNNAWGMGTLNVNGVLNIENQLKFATGGNGNQTTNVIAGSGTIKVGTLYLGNVGTYSINVNRLELGGFQTGDGRNTSYQTYLNKTTIAVVRSFERTVRDVHNFVLNSAEGTTFELQDANGGATEAWFASKFTGTGKLIKTGAGTLAFSGDNSGYSGAVEINAGIISARSSNALGTGTITVNESGVLRVAVAGGLTAGDIVFNEGGKFAIDLEKMGGATEDTALTIIASSAISFNSPSRGAVTSDLIESYFDADNSILAEWANYSREWIYDNNVLTLTLSIPEPSAFGLLAGLGALALAGSRRRRKA